MGQTGDEPLNGHCALCDAVEELLLGEVMEDKPG